MKSSHKKAAIAVVLAGAGVFAADYSMKVYASEQFQQRVVSPLQERGFEVTHGEMSSLYSKGFGVMTVGDLEINKKGVSFEVKDTELSKNTVAFSGSSMADLHGKTVMQTGSGFAKFVPGSELQIDISDVNAVEPEVLRWSALADGYVLDLALSVKTDHQNVSADFSLGSPKLGKLKFQSKLDGLDIWAAESAEQLGVAVQSAFIDSAEVTFVNEGGFESTLARVAEQQGVAASDAAKFLKRGIAGSRLPESIKGPLGAFIASPGAITASIKPEAVDGMRMRVVDVATGIQMMTSGYAQPAVLAEKTNFELRATSK
jgi:hypothetical protein